jgi:hypothetical protein
MTKPELGSHPSIVRPFDQTQGQPVRPSSRHTSQGERDASSEKLKERLFTEIINKHLITADVAQR